MSSVVFVPKRKQEKNLKTMEENEESKPFMQLLGKTQNFSDNGSVQNSSSPSFQNSNQEPDRLENLQRQAHTIQEILVRLPKSVVSNPESPYQRSISSPQPHEIYQNLPVMGSGLRQPPALPPKEQGKVLTPVIDKILLMHKRCGYLNRNGFYT